MTTYTSGFKHELYLTHKEGEEPYVIRAFAGDPFISETPNSEGNLSAVSVHQGVVGTTYNTVALKHTMDIGLPSGSPDDLYLLDKYSKTANAVFNATSQYHVNNIWYQMQYVYTTASHVVKYTFRNAVLVNVSAMQHGPNNNDQSWVRKYQFESILVDRKQDDI